jgi:hypothetical protein
MMRKALITLFAALLAVLANPAPAQAGHTGYFAYNADNVGHNALVRTDLGLQEYQFLYPGQYSDRGLTGIMVRSGQRVKFQSLNSGAYYWTACGEDYAAAGRVWQGTPYYPTTGTSLKIVDKAVYPYGAASTCNG